MDAKPKSNKMKRLEARERRARKAARQGPPRLDPRSEADARQTRADAALRAARAHARKPESLLDAVMRGEAVRAPQRSVLTHLSRALETARQARPGRVEIKAVRRLVMRCLDHGRLFDGHDAPRFVAALVALAMHAGRWVRSPETWEAPSHNAWRQFRSLVRHLTARYDVPAFMDSAWLEGPTAAAAIHQGWYLHVAQGGNLRTAHGLPVPLTKMQAHLYLQAPADFDVMTGFRWAQLIDLGADERLVRSVATTRAAADFGHDEFWLSVFRWLVAHPMLDPSLHAPIVDYLYHQRFEPSVPNPEAGRPGAPRLVPPRPHLSMKGRDPETLLRAVTAWHRELSRARAAEGTVWAASGLPRLEFEEGKGENHRVFTIDELTSARALVEEGRAMGHCVGSYARSCASGRVSIWSLTVRNHLGQTTRLLTLEVASADRQIVQARRKFNAMPGAHEHLLLRRWADAGGPTLSKWLAR